MICTRSALFLHITLAVAIWSPTQAQEVEPVPESYRKGFASISESSLRATLRFLASAELEGRESGTRGYDVASLFVACLLEARELEPVGESDSFYQDFRLVRRSWDLEKAALTVQVPEGKARRVPLKDRVAISAKRDIDWKDPWVFAGFGEGAVQDSRDDFHGLPIEDRVVLILPRDPGRPDLREARRRGAERIVVISDPMVKRKLGLRSREMPGYLLEKSDRTSDDVQVVYIPESVVDELLFGIDTSVQALRETAGRPIPRELAGLEVSFRIPLVETTRKTRNVLACLEGSDPLLKDEYVVLGAHLDHIGVQGGKVFPGADDDASGVSAVLGVADALLANERRPRRSVVFAFFAAEEKGLFGSRYFVDHPLVPLDGIVLQIQLDMVGRDSEPGHSGTSGGAGAGDSTKLMHRIGTDRHSAELDPWLRAVNRRVGLTLEHGNEKFYAASDHYWFGRSGIPVAFFFSGLHKDYHKPTDTIEKINFSKVLSMTRLAFGLAFEVADRERRLTINRF